VTLDDADTAPQLEVVGELGLRFLETCEQIEEAMFAKEVLDLLTRNHALPTTPRAVWLGCAGYHEDRRDPQVTLRCCW